MSAPVQQRRSCLGGVFVFLACWVFRRHHRKYLLPQICVCFPFSVCLKRPACSRIAQMQNRTYNLFSPSLLMRRNIQRKHHSSSISCFRADETSTECPAWSLEYSFIVYDFCFFRHASRSEHRSEESLIVIKLLIPITASRTRFPAKIRLIYDLLCHYFSDYAAVLKRYFLLMDV